MIGLALVTVVATLGAGLRGSTEDVRQEAGPRRLRRDRQGRRRLVPGRLRQGRSRGRRRQGRLGRALGHRARSPATRSPSRGIDPKTIDHFYRFKWQQGSLAGLADGGAIVSKGFAEAAPPQGRQRAQRADLERREARRCAWSASTSRRRWTRCSATSRSPRRRSTGPSPARRTVHVRGRQLEGGAGQGHRPAIPDAKLTTEAEFAKSRADGLEMILKMLYVLLGFSVVVSLFGMVNTLVLAVYERTRELGMLRAVGMTRRQARRMIRHESIITALIGAAMGIPLGDLPGRARHPGAVEVRRRALRCR